LAVLIGDVCGHGPREAAFGAALRAGWKAIALSGEDDPAAWITALDEAFFRDGRIDTYVTMCTGLVDAPAGVVRMLSLGHPQPVLLGRPVRLLDVPPFAPLGIGVDDAWKATELAWNGQPMLFYTDGLVENPNEHGKPQRWFAEGLLRWLDAHPEVRSPNDYADELVRAATERRALHDDVALLIVTCAR
jgi:serine phosphatase RsbU (regulator of sigma subunit)